MGFAYGAPDILAPAVLVARAFNPDTGNADGCRFGNIIPHKRWRDLLHAVSQRQHVIVR